MTVDCAHVLGSAELYREWGYTAMSRGRRSNKLYVVAPDSLGSRGLRATGPPTSRGGARRSTSRLSVTREQTAAVDVATMHWLKRSPTWALRDRLEDLHQTGAQATLAQQVKEREQLARRAEGLERQIAAAELTIAKLNQSRPSRLRRPALKAHKAGEDLHARSHSGLSRIRASMISEIAKAGRIDRAPSQPPLGRRSGLRTSSNSRRAHAPLGHRA